MQPRVTQHGQYKHVWAVKSFPGPIKSSAQGQGQQRDVAHRQFLFPGTPKLDYHFSEPCQPVPDRHDLPVTKMRSVFGKP